MSDPNAMDARGVTALAKAAGGGDAAAVRDLLGAGAHPDAPWSEGHPRRADFEARAEKGRYGFRIPLFAAVESGSAACVELLLGADVKAVDSQARSALFYAPTEAIARLLLKAGLSLDQRDAYGWTPLDGAVTDGSLARAEVLLAVGADPNATHDRGYTVFMSAVSSMERKTEMLDLLLKRGADPRAVSQLGYTALHAAIDVNGGEANAEPSVRATLGSLVRLGLDLEGRNNAGETPLLRAIGCGTDVEVRVLLDLGAKVQDPELIFAAVSDPLKLEPLLRAGADPAAKRAGGETALDHVRKLRRDAAEKPPKDPEWAKKWIARLDRSIELLEAAQAR